MLPSPAPNWLARVPCFTTACFPSAPDRKNRNDTDYEDVSFLEMLGYKQELFRGMHGFMNFAVNISCINSVACVVRIGTAQCVEWWKQH